MTGFEGYEIGGELWQLPVKHRLIMNAFKKAKELGLKYPPIYDDLISKKVKKK